MTITTEVIIVRCLLRFFCHQVINTSVLFVYVFGQLFAAALTKLVLSQGVFFLSESHQVQLSLIHLANFYRIFY